MSILTERVVRVGRAPELIAHGKNQFQQPIELGWKCALDTTKNCFILSADTANLVWSPPCDRARCDLLEEEGGLHGYLP